MNEKEKLVAFEPDSIIELDEPITGKRRLGLVASTGTAFYEYEDREKMPPRLLILAELNPVLVHIAFWTDELMESGNIKQWHGFEDLTCALFDTDLPGKLSRYRAAQYAFKTGDLDLEAAVAAGKAADAEAHERVAKLLSAKEENRKSDVMACWLSGQMEPTNKPETEGTEAGLKFPPGTLIELYYEQGHPRQLALVAEDGSSCRFYVDYEHQQRPYPLLDFMKPEIAPNYQILKQNILRDYPECYDNFALMVDKILEAIPGYDELTFERAVRYSYETPSLDPAEAVLYALHQGYQLKLDVTRQFQEMDRISDEAFEACRAEGMDIPPMGSFNYPPVNQIETDKSKKGMENFSHSDLLASLQRVQAEAALAEKTNPTCKNRQ